MFTLIGRKGLSKKSFLAFSLVDKSALIINFEGHEVKGLSKGRYEETFAGKMHKRMLGLYGLSCEYFKCPLYQRSSKQFVVWVCVCATNFNVGNNF